MTTQISSNNIQPTTLAALSPVTITGITVTNSSWTPLDDSAVSTSGGFIVITGTNFATGCNVIIGSTNATSVAFVNSTTLRVQVPAMSAGTYVVYVTNTNGTTAIIVNGLTYSGTPTWVTASPLPQGASGTPISIQLSATGDTPLTYALQAGSTLPSGLTLSSSGLLSGTVSGLTVQTTYNFTIEVIDPQLQDSPKAFAITIVAGDQFWDNVTLLLPGTTSTSIFNDDASTNNFPITVVGNTRPNNFGPYTPGYYSNFFDGTGDSLQIGSGNTGVTFGTADFTIEAWIYWNSLSSESAIMFGSSIGWTFYVFPANKLQWGRTSPQTPVNLLTGNTTLNTGVWYHIAVTRASGTVTLWVNGVSDGTVADSANYSASGDLRVGISHGGQFFNGYMSNVRVVKGTAVYTTAFTPPTQPLTAVANTSILTCQSNRFIDNSTNNFAITRNGDVRIDGFDSFVPSSSTATLGSTYFDGTGDYLSTAGNAAFAMGTGDFTLEAWIYPTSFASYWPITGQFASLSTGQGFNLFALNSSRQIELYYDGQTYAILSSATATLNTWNHVTVARQGSTIRGFINGVLAGTITYSGIFGTSSSNLEIGGTTRSGGNLWATGYISNARVVKGTALYTTAFTPPAAPLTAVAGTSLLTCQTNQPNNNNMFLDSSTNNFLITRNGNTTQGTFSPYAENWSNYFDGSTGYLAIPNNAAFAFGSGSLTVEAWINTGVRTDFQSVIGTFDGGSNAWYIHTNASGTITYGLSASAPYVASVQVCDNIWHHVAMVRNGASDLRLYVDGVLADSRTDSSQPTPAAEIRIASLSSGFTRYFNGYISNVRVVKGTAVYTSNFTPSTTPLQSIPNTSLLTCRDSSFVDDSANRFTVTRNGNASIQKFGPFAGTTLPTPYYGAYFDGTGDFLTIPDNAALQMGTGNFTIEFWINFSSIASYQTPFDKGYTGSGALAIQTGNGNGRMIIYASGSAVITESGTATVGTWIHYALVRNGSTLTLYRDGTSSGSATNSTNFNNATNLAIGAAGAGSGTPYPIIGYMSNVRVVKGTAVYTSNFTPSTIPLTDITGTSLLTCQSNRFIDNSTNNFAITRNGDTRIDGFDSFVPSSSTATLGSTYFDGNGDYLSTAGNAAFAMGTGDFTLEAWIYPTSFASYWPITGQFASLSTGQGFNLFALNSSRQIELYYDGQTYAALSSTTATLNTWNHVTVARQGSTIRGFINGVLAGTITYSGIFGTSSSNLEIGGTTRSGGNLWATGYISNVRIIKGTAVYTANFTPPTQPLTAITNTSLLTCQTNQPNNNNMFLDSSTNNFLVTRNGNTTQGTFSPYAENWSNYFDGTGDYLAYTGGSSINFGTSDFTIELWVNMVNTGTFSAFLRPDDTGTFPEFGYDWSSSLLKFDSRNGAIANINTTLTASVWNHLAVSRSGTSLRVFVNGTQVGSTTTNSTNFGNTTGTIRIGGSGFSNSHSVNGYISNFRIVKGTAVYTGNFTPSTTPLLPIANTSLLTCRDSSFVDDSANRFAITVVGNTSVQRFGPFAGTTLPTPYYGAFFDGNGDGLTTPTNAAFTYGTGDFCVEGWYYFTGGVGGSGYSYLFAQGASTGNASLGLYIQDSVYKVWNGSAVITSSASFVQGTWVHLAVTRSGTTMRLFVNGVQSGSATNSNNITTGSTLGISIGRWAEISDSNYITGYVSNFRVVKGSAVYTSNFTPSTTPLTAITGTSLLTCQSATFIDNSTNNFAITAVGNSQPTFFNPFTVTYSTLQNYSPSVFGGSMSFDGTGDDLRFNASNISNDNWTIECWVYFNNFSTTNPYVWSWGGGNSNYFGLYRNSSAGKLYFTSGISGNFTNLISTTTIQAGSWYHTAIVKLGGTCSLYVNGINEASASTSLTDNIEVTIGYEKFNNNANNYLNGYISDLRIIRGTALYTSNFVPNNQPLTAVQNSVLLLNGTGAGIYDASAQNDLETLADSNLSTSIVKFGNTSMFFDGTGDFLRFDNSTFRLISGNFTIECHFYETSATGFLFTMSSRNWWPQNTAGEGMNGLAFGPRSILLGIGSGGGAQYNYSSGATLNTWNHIAVCRVNSTVSVYINGLQVLSQTINNQPIGSLNTSPGIGLLDAFGGTPRLFFTGYIQDFRITSGVARYTTNFTPPTTPFLTN